MRHNVPMNEHAGAPLSQALSEEYALLRPNSGFETTGSKDLFEKLHAEPRPPGFSEADDIAIHELLSVKQLHVVNLNLNLYCGILELFEEMP